ncbi:hypothetical protein, partial [Salmonella enterica]
HTIVSIKNDGHYFCRAGGNRPDGLNEPVTVNFYFCQFLFSSLFIIKYCFWPGYIFVNSLPTAGDKVICWRNSAHNLKDLFIVCYHGKILT